MTAVSVDVESLRNECRESLYFLANKIIGFKDWDDVHTDMEMFLARPSAYKLLLEPRGHLKTTMCTISKSIQYILKDPNVRILIANQIWDKARDMLYEIKEILTTKSDLPKIFGDFQSPVWNSDGIIVKQRTKAFKEPTVATTGVEAESTGGHYDIIFLDDLVGLQNYQTPESREKVKRFFRSMFNLLEPGGKIIMLGTRWHLDDVYADILEKDAQFWDVTVRKVVEDGRVIFPKKFNQKFDPVQKTWTTVTEPCLDYIEWLRTTLKPSEFYSQYMNEPIAAEDQKFRPEYFKYFNQRPPGLFVGMTMDNAIGQKREADSTAIVIAGMDTSHQLYVLDVLRGHWRTSEIINNAISMYRKWNPDVVGMESNGFQIALKDGLEQKMREENIYIPIQELQHGSERSKELRIEALEPFYRAGLVHHANWMKDGVLEEELLGFPKGRHDDVIDAQSMQLEILIPGEEAFEDREPKPGTMAADLAELDRKHYRMNVDSFLRDIIPKDL